ncbi:hypothetical protein A2955_00530 [Candidatus Woesebacteria bacterium RIFCSPLOWO2_01_FULL_37_19]|uniref:O-antigen ligase-related domain-containing protein n=1 Tax=Candidatus Woesebacteria bacterium RIFCSPLOWO2_01_FULL_37_19 TaxID=1802514 RepID=A0A1F8B738_9BACT|nr:MAG: hypothetical protein A2955_00530 [Candidatus Woesebacteria bacterium RIFCSPLOWO2_01_FULL_37_19]
MAITKKPVSELGKYIVYFYLLIFPFGQLLRVNLNKIGIDFSFPLIDLIVTLSLFTILIKKRGGYFKNFYGFMAAASFSLIISLVSYSFLEILPGLLYFQRLISYFALFAVVIVSIREKTLDRLSLIQFLQIVSFFIIALGWLQYFMFPDLRSLRYVGWDDHLYRIVGSFLDPGFAGLILVLGGILTLGRFFATKNKIHFALFILSAITVAFTYSRASYLAFLIAVITLGFLYKKFLLPVVFTVSFLLSLTLLPRPSSEGVKLERTYSISAKFQNYFETIKIIKNSPVFGVGYNSLCLVRQKLFNDNSKSHSCYGSDSSLLFLLATTGVVGFMTLANTFLRIFKDFVKNQYYKILIASFLAIIIHSLFLNSLFYSWVMGWMVILMGITIKKRSKTVTYG